MHRVEHVCVKSSIHLYNYVACTSIIKYIRSNSCTGGVIISRNGQ